MSESFYTQTDYHLLGDGTEGALFDLLMEHCGDHIEDLELTRIRIAQLRFKSLWNTIRCANELIEKKRFYLEPVWRCNFETPPIFMGFVKADNLPHNEDLFERAIMNDQVKQ